MKALPSITFGQFRCSAGDVTARVSKGRQILSARAVHNHITTVAQAARRCSFAAISRSYKKLTQAQMAGWAVLAEKLKGSVVFGQAAQKTPNSKKRSASSKKTHQITTAMKHIPLTLILTLTALIPQGCSRKIYPHTIQNTHTTETITKIIRDTIIQTQADTAILQTLIRCDSTGRARL